MNNIEQKALALLNEVLAERVDWQMIGTRAKNSSLEALCRAIEQHESFRQEVSDVVEQALSFGDVESLRRKGVLSRFIIPKPKPDPLAQTLGDFDGTLWEPEDVLRFRAALEARGLEIREKGQ